MSYAIGTRVRLPKQPGDDPSDHPGESAEGEVAEDTADENMRLVLPETEGFEFVPKAAPPAREPEADPAPPRRRDNRHGFTGRDDVSQLARRRLRNLE
jgi:hypothetical protein